MKVLDSFSSCLIIISSLGLFVPVSAFLSSVHHSKSNKLELISRMATIERGINICDLPGDPSLILTTNIDLGDKKLEIMKCEHWDQHAGFMDNGLSVSCISELIGPNLIFFCYRSQLAPKPLKLQRANPRNTSVSLAYCEHLLQNYPYLVTHRQWMSPCLF
jgi:hypothetical protein